MRPWLGRSLYILPWLPAAATAIYMKWLVLEDVGILVATRGSGLIDRKVGVLDEAAFYRQELLLDLLVIPALLVALCGLVRPRRRPLLVASVSILLVLFLYANLMSYANLGRYLSLWLLHDAIRWGLANPHYITLYLSPAGLFKLGVIILVVLLAAWWAYRHDGEARGSGAPGRPWRIFVGGIALVPALVSCSGLYSGVPDSAYHRPLLQQTAESFFSGAGDEGRFNGLGQRELSSFYRSLTATPAYRPDPRYSGAARGSDLILFVFETGPARALDITGDLAGFPNLRRLRDHALIGAAHHSTYPYTSRALFSLFSGCYPTDELDTRFRAGRLRLPGLFSTLRAHGYATATYSPFRSQFTEDEAMFQSLGVERHVVAGAARGETPWERTFSADRAALAALTRDLAALLAADRRYAVAFLPQVGHAPWHDLDGAGDDYPARGRALLALQDRWLGELLDLLERHGRLDKTVIVVTADHGIRTRAEDPQFSGGTIDAYSFHVPLLVWSPPAFAHGVTTTWITSHIDVAPTILELLGAGGESDAMQGALIWEPGLERRIPFFFGKGYLGADGFRRDGRYYMVRQLFDTAYASERLAFSEAQRVTDEEEGARARRLLESMEALRRSWIDHFGERGAI